MHIIITGFMGTGKSTVGRMLGQMLDMPWVDIDGLIEEKADRTVAEIFAGEGEDAFRQREVEAFREALKRPPSVISTGGGTLLHPDSRRLAKENGIVVGLMASPEDIMRRVGGPRAASRPLLDSDVAGLRERLAGRAPAYAAALHIAVDTTGQTPEETTRQVAAAVEQYRRQRPVSVTVRSAAGNYAVRIGSGLLARAGLDTAAVIGGRRVLIVTDPQVGEHYLDKAVQSYKNAGFQVFTVTVPAGEESKSLRWLEHIHDAALEAGLDRSSAFVALGGGVIGDLAGFAAATFMRGVPVVQIPTTLLAQIDASVGGKTAVNHPKGKNLIGAFHPPVLVVCDLDVLDTLPQREWAAGMAEAVKHGILADGDYFSWIEENAAALSQKDPELRLHLVLRSVQIKAKVVTADERERGLRATLNLGHTTGHAIEAALGYKDWLHGEAVAVGLVAAARIAQELGQLPADPAGRVERLLSQLGLPVRLPSNVTPQQVLQATGSDKKRLNDRQRWILPVAIGQVVISDDVPEAVVTRVLSGLSKNSS